MRELQLSAVREEQAKEELYQHASLYTEHSGRLAELDVCT